MFLGPKTLYSKVKASNLYSTRENDFLKKKKHYHQNNIPNGFTKEETRLVFSSNKNSKNLFCMYL